MIHCYAVSMYPRITDTNYVDGIDRGTFELAVQHVMCSRFGYDDTIAKLVLHEYTTWHRRNDPVFQRRQYVHVSSHIKAPLDRDNEGAFTHRCCTSVRSSVCRHNPYTKT